VDFAADAFFFAGVRAAAAFAFADALAGESVEIAAGVLPLP
jgi:hypothetical protein